MESHWNRCQTFQSQIHYVHLPMSLSEKAAVVLHYVLWKWHDCSMPLQMPQEIAQCKVHMLNVGNKCQLHSGGQAAGQPPAAGRYLQKLLLLISVRLSRASQCVHCMLNAFI